jgi:hypothetical protein
VTIDASCEQCDTPLSRVADTGCWMARRGRRQSTFLWWILILGLGIFAWGLRSWALGCLTVVMFCLYELFLVNATCDVETQAKKPCEANVQGRVRACGRRAHQRAKRAALWESLTGLPNVFARFRVMFGRSQTQAGWILQPAPGSVSARKPNLQGLVNLLLAAIGTAAGVVSAWLTWRG